MVMSQSMEGVSISLVANLLINVGLNLQKIAHSAQQAERDAKERDEQGLPGREHVTSPNGSYRSDHTPIAADGGVFLSFRWVIGLAIQLMGESGNMVAYSFAATSIIAPLGAVGLLANLVIATVFLGEPFRPRDVVGSLLAGGGAAVVAVWAPSNTLEMSNHELLYDVILQYRALYLVGVAMVGLILYALLHVPDTLH